MRSEERLEALDMNSAHIHEPDHMGLVCDEVAGKGPQRVVRDIDGRGPKRQRNLIQVTPRRDRQLRRPRNDRFPIAVTDHRNVDRLGRGHWTGPVVASIRPAAR